MLVELENEMRPRPEVLLDAADREGVGTAGEVRDGDGINARERGECGGCVFDVSGEAPRELRGAGPADGEELLRDREDAEAAEALEEGEVEIAVERVVRLSEDGEHAPVAGGGVRRSPGVSQQLRGARAHRGVDPVLHAHGLAPGVADLRGRRPESLAARSESGDELLLAEHRDRRGEEARLRSAADHERGGHRVGAGVRPLRIGAPQRDDRRHEDVVDLLRDERVDVADGQLDRKADADAEMPEPESERLVG